MTEASASDLLDRVVDAGGVLLRVESLHPDGTKAAALLLTFDVGRLLLCARPGVPELTALLLEKPGEVPGGLVDAGQDEPWWRILGNALCAVEARGTNGLRFQFRRSEDNPRFVAITARGNFVDVKIETT